MKRVNILVGRFQPFTKGHYVCVETAKKLKNLTTVICMIDTPESKVDKRHPFTTDLMLYTYNSLFSNDPNIEKVVPVKNADIVKIADGLRNYGYEIASWTCGTDRYDSYSRMGYKYKEPAGLTDDFEVIEVKRGDDDISATKARTCLLNNDKQAFDSFLPTGVTFTDEMFSELKQQIDKVYDVSENMKRNLTLENRIALLEKKLFEAKELDHNSINDTLDNLKYVSPNVRLDKTDFDSIVNIFVKANDYVEENDLTPKSLKALDRDLDKHSAGSMQNAIRILDSILDEKIAILKDAKNLIKTLKPLAKTIDQSS